MNENADVYGVDLGTMFYQTAKFGKDGEIDIEIIRNAFVELDATEDTEDILKQNHWNYVKSDNKFYILGEDSLKVAKMLPGKIELRRPMADGVLNKGEDQKMLVLAKMIDSSVGKAPSKNSVVCTCVSSESADKSQDSRFHRARIEGMFKRNGWNVKVIEEAHAVIMSERPVVVEDGVEYPYSGIGVSFGAGRVNCVLAYKGMQVVGMSVARSGDWIDQKVAEATDTPISQVTSIKEKKLDFDNIDYDDDVIFALDAYYGAMMEYVFGHFAKKFSEVESEFDAPMDIVVAGGTSMPKGFTKKLHEVLKQLGLPFEVKRVVRAKDPRNSVVKGCLAAGRAYQKKLAKEADSVEETEE